MNRRLFLVGALPFAAVPHALARFDRDHDDHGKHKGRDHDDRHDHDDHGGHNEGNRRYFRPEDRALLGHYYPVRTLPPGLQKKYARTGTVPPGWQTRIRPLPVAVVERLPPPPPNCERGYVDGYAVVYNRTTRVIVDTVDLIGALTGH
ncbi:MAG TPA: hypothetical protein VLJ11_10380 [Bryobacteraceae bacterium]|nr:hypothetical protein [Bryobacteraceae bacterium]